LYDDTTSADVNALLFENFTSGRSSKVQVLRSPDDFHEVARSGATLPSWSILTRPSYINGKSTSSQAVPLSAGLRCPIP
jgi:hypothetical protein